ncbi:MAG: ribbon-helix-helix protein, CopG family [Deltaproteobacteria bacterium]|nr:ribbon-helix-helix protein, CopG family [Deltaproteobacteria bacterium]
MARFMVSMPDEMVKKLDRRAQEEHRSRSELLREAARRHLASAAPVEAKESPTPRRTSKQKVQKRWTKKSLEQHLLEKGLARRGCPGLDSLVGPVKGPVDMKRVLRITKRLAGLSRQIIEDREDRL